MSCSSVDVSDEDTFYAAMNLTSASILPMVLNSAIQLNLLQIIKDAGPAASLSASDLVSHIPTSHPQHAATHIDRILLFLSAHSVLTCTLKPLPHTNHLHRFYSLMPVCKYLVPNEEGASLASISLMLQSKVLIDSWYHVKDMVLEGGIPFNRAYGMSIFEYAAVDPKFNNLFNQGLYESSSIMMKKVIQAYDGFEGVKSLVDVGGGTGATLKTILAKHPTIKAINFDLPHVVKDAPPHPGKHIIIIIIIIIIITF